MSQTKARHTTLVKLCLTTFYVQNWLSIYNWNPGPRRGKEGAIEKRIAGRWHIITQQKAFEKIDHVLLTSQFHVTHYGGCAILYNKATLYPNIDIKSIYLYDTRWDLPVQVMEGDQGWAMPGVLSRASCRRTPPHGWKDFTVCNLHISKIYAKNEVLRRSSSSQSVPL